MTCAVRHCMEFRFHRFDSSKSTSALITPKGTIKDPLESILELTELMNTNETNDQYDLNDMPQLLASFIRNPESVLQELDIQRLRAIIYRDVVRPDRNKAGKNVVVIVVNVALFVCMFTSVLCRLLEF